MKKTKIALLLAALLVAGTASAARFGAQVEPVTEQLRDQAAVQAPAQAAPAAPATAPAAPAAAPAPKVAPAAQGSTADDMAQAFIDSAVEQKKLSTGQGWNEAEKVYVAVGTAVYDTKSLLNEEDFLKVRSMKAIEAQLNAKELIINFIRTDISVDNLLTMPDTGLSTAFDKELARMQREIELRTKAYQEALADVDAAKAAQFGSINAEDLIVEGIVAYMNRFGVNIDLGKLEAKQAERLKKAQDNLLALQTDLDDLKAKAEQLRNSLRQENTTKVETISKMPLVGAMTAAQYESRIDDQYQITFVMTWSPKQERAVRAMMDGSKLDVPKGRRGTLAEYVRNNDWSTAVGGRKFVDENGDYIILGVGSWPINGNGSAARRTAEGFARAFAQSSIATALRADVEAQAAASVKMQELQTGMNSSETKTQLGESIAQMISEKVSNMQLQGLSRRFGKVMYHPISGQKMFVTVYSMSVSQAIAAKQIEKTNFAAAEYLTDINKHSQGVKAGLDASLAAKEASTVEYNKGLAEGRASSDQINNPAPVAQPVAAEEAPAAVQTQNTPRGGATSVRGAGSSTDAFGF